MKGSYKKYDKENTKSVLLKLNKKTDADIIEMLDAVPSKMGYIKDLIRQDIEVQKKDWQIASLLFIMSLEQRFNDL